LRYTKRPSFSFENWAFVIEVSGYVAREEISRNYRITAYIVLWAGFDNSLAEAP